MANFKAPDEQNRSPKLEILPDLRQRLTRTFDLTNEVTKAPAPNGNQPGASVDLLAWGTADVDYPNLRLVKQDFTGQFEENGNDPKSPTAKPPHLTRIYETIPATAEIQVGEDDVEVDQDGLTTVVQHFLQFSTAVAGITPTYLTVGSSSITSPNGKTCVLKDEKRTDDGTLQRIDRTYISAGQISQDITTKYDGALTLTKLVYVNEVPPTPSGATLIDADVQHIAGLPVYTYTFAKGAGQISEQIEYRLSPDQGTTGVTVYTLKYLGPPLGSNPISQPGGTEEIAITFEEQDGYRVWTGIYASGQGTIATEVERRLNDKLQITTITAINAAPSAPSPSLGGTLELIKTDVRNGTRFEDGTVIYTYTWAEAAGGATGAVISTDVEYLQSIDQGTNGVTRTTIRTIVSPAATQQPTSLSGSVLIDAEYTDAEGYGIWKTVWAKGSGTVLTATRVLEAGVLLQYRIVALGTAPSTPSSTIGGTVVLVDSSDRTENGYKVFDYTWAEANGQSSITTRGEPDGALLYEVITKTDSATTPSYPGTGTAYLIDQQTIQNDGYVTNRALYKKPPATVALLRQMKFPMPGQIELTSPDPGWTFVPPVEMDILATETISYGTSQDNTTPFTVKAYAGLQYSYLPTGQTFPIVGNKGTGGYLSGATGGSGGSATFNGVSVDSYEYVITGSTPSAPPSGSTVIENNNDIYLTDVTGTVVYRNRKVTYSF